MEFIEDFKIQCLKEKGLIITWDWSNFALSQFNTKNATTIIKLLYPDDVLMKSVQLSNSQSKKYVFKNLKNVNLKLCLNVSFPEEVQSKPDQLYKSYEICRSFIPENWPSVHVSLGSSFAAFVVLLLIVGLIFFTQKLGKKRRIMDKKTSIKNKSRDSYMYIYNDTKTTEEEKNNFPLLQNQEKRCSFGNSGDCDCNTMKIDGESICDIESINSMGNCETTENVEKKDYEIIKCDCGLIHLIGTELEYDDFLQKPVQYIHKVPLAPQDTISIKTDSTL